MTDRSLVVVTAGLSQPSATRLLADRLASRTEYLLHESGETVRIEVIELRTHAQDLTNNLMTGFPSPALRAAIDAVTGADGLIAVTPIFNASFSGLFKTFFDVLERDSLAGLPVLMAATAGTARHSLALEHALRPLFAYMGAATVPTAVFAAAEDWGEGDSSAERDLGERIERAATELAAAMVSRTRRPTVDAYADPTPFEQLLADPPRG
jgi:FMN reductase